MSEQEEWRPIPGFPGYEVSDLGRVVSHLRKTPRLLIPSMSTNGYYRKVCLHRDGALFNRSIHTLVLEAFRGPRGTADVCRHLDGDPLNNALSNLTWGTHSENAQDRVLHGRDAHGRKTSCIHGHPFAPDNTYITPQGARRCRVCHRRRDAASKARRTLRAAGVSELAA